MSSAFERFKDNYFRYPSREGPDLAVLDNLDENEREEAEDLLIHSLTPNRIYSIQALGYLRSQRAFPRLIELLPKSKGVARVYIAQALWRIGRYGPALSILCQTLAKRKIFGSNAARREAAIALREIDERQSVAALSAVIEDKDYLVRYHAQRSLAILLGLQEELESLESVMMTGAFCEQQEARDELRRLVKDVLSDHSQQR
jgi:HEAT repeat protein